jgi:hypothetical protein
LSSQKRLSTRAAHETNKKNIAAASVARESFKYFTPPKLNFATAEKTGGPFRAQKRLS